MQQNTLPEDTRPKDYLGSSLLFIFIFTTATVVGLLLFIIFPLPFIFRYKLSQAWCRLIIWGAKVFCGLTYEVEGLENLDPNKPAVVLCNHQSAWETLAMRLILPMQAALVKRELLYFPIWGWALLTVKTIVINRKKQREALQTLLKKGTECLNEGIWVLVFPEGTRTAAGEVRPFSLGGAMLAHKSGFPVVPVVHNAGDYWPRYSFFKYPGVIKVKIGKQIETKGRKAAEINAEAESWVRQALEEIR